MVDVEGEAAWLLRPWDGAPGARALAAHYELPVLTVPRTALRGIDAATWPLNGRPAIYVAAKLSTVQLRWAIVHEVAEWHLERIGYAEPDVEQVAEALTAALVAPREPFRRAVRSHGRELPRLAERFTTTQTSAALRLAEVRCVEAAAVVRPGLVRVRAPDGFVLPTPAELRRVAETGREGLERHVLTDARRRVALVAA